MVTKEIETINRHEMVPSTTQLQFQLDIVICNLIGNRVSCDDGLLIYASMINYFLELRRRLIKVCVVFLGILTVSFYFSEPLFHWLIYPLQHLLPAGQHLVATQLTSAVFTPLSIAFHAACLLTLPYLLWQVWQFVYPALYGHERSVIKMPLIASFLLLFTGMAFAYWAVLPVMFSFFIAYIPDKVQLMPDMAYSIDFITRILLIFGLCFQVPLVCYVLVRLGLITIQTLKSCRPYVIVGSFVLGMLLTPPDVVSQILLALPLWGLFELGIIACGGYPWLNVSLSE